VTGEKAELSFGIPAQRYDTFVGEDDYCVLVRTEHVGEI